MQLTAVDFDCHCSCQLVISDASRLTHMPILTSDFLTIGLPCISAY